MIIDRRIPLVGDRFLLGKIQEPADLFKIVPITVLAQASKLSPRKIKNRDTLLVNELRMLSKLVNIPAAAFIEWSVKEGGVDIHLHVNPDEDTALKIDLVRDRIGLGKLHLFSDIFDILPKTILAGLINVNNNKMSQLIAFPGLISLKQVKQMARVFEIDPLTLFQLIENELRQAEGKSIKQLIPTIKLPHKNYVHK